VLASLSTDMWYSVATECADAVAQMVALGIAVVMVCGASWAN